ncbi:hypothetical protein SDJN02_20540 [Cucurbita argyrosperma subsp. argyrosperma]|nr:hypothetical protein SDJN02_20540 [Cucurbita argyrosperma subsp. argyrosperma]
MAQILAPSVQWQLRTKQTSMSASSITPKMWTSLLLKQSSKVAVKSSAKFRVLALKSDGSTINRMEELLNLDVTPYTDKIIAEYIWIGGSGIDLRSKSRTISKPVEHPSELPKWNYDGSSTGQAPGEDSEVILYPQAIFKDPFRGGNNILVICDAYTPAGEPIPTNKRHRAAEIFSNKKVVDEIPWYGIEQEYTLLQTNVKWPLGWPVGAYPGPQGPYYCGVGADKSFGRDISDAHYKACLYAGINISGTNGEVMPGQWEYQVGPSVGIEAGDHIWCSRYILERITEQAGVVLTLDPKPIEGDWNGAGCHTNYSTKSMREEGGFDVIKKAILNLSLRHNEHISAYGEGNERRLTGKHETASINTFSWGVANRGCSIRVGRDTEKQGKGYLEDRRPASNMDPYVVTSLLAETTLLWEPTLEAEALAAQKLSLKTVPLDQLSSDYEFMHTFFLFSDGFSHQSKYDNRERTRELRDCKDAVLPEISYAYILTQGSAVNGRFVSLSVRLRSLPSSTFAPLGLDHALGQQSIATLRHRLGHRSDLTATADPPIHSEMFEQWREAIGIIDIKECCGLVLARKIRAKRGRTLSSFSPGLGISRVGKRFQPP